MSNIYIQEPPTNGKVLLETTVGDIDIELWSKETPKASRNFVQLCLEGYYNNTIFHRIIKGFIAQGGDPTGTGNGGESIYGEPFKDEFHSRLRFVRRGLVAMANAGKDDNGSQFFFTFAAAPELQKKHTIFGKVTGNTIYNMIKLENSLVDEHERPVYPPKIIKVKVLNNPFPDIIPRVLKRTDDANEKKDEKNSNIKATKDFKLLSFGDEAEEDEEEINEISKGFRGKSKSSHDLIDDPRLSSVPAVDVDDDEIVEREEKKRLLSSDDEGNDADKLLLVDSIRKKLKVEKQDGEIKVEIDEEENDENHPARKIKEYQEEYRKLKKEMQNKNKEKSETAEAITVEEEDVPEPVKTYFSELEKYEDKKTQKKKTTDNEDKTLELLKNFQRKLQSTREKWDTDTDDVEVEEEKDVEEHDELNDPKWMAHKLRFESHETKVKDANMKDEDTYEIYDPRNPINQRRREASKQSMRKKR